MPGTSTALNPWIRKPDEGHTQDEAADDLDKRGSRGAPKGFRKGARR